MVEEKSFLSANKILDEISAETEKYTAVIKNNERFEEAKKIRKKIRTLEKELKKLLSENENRR